MKYSIFFMLLGVLSVSAESYAQKTKLSIDVQNGTLYEVVSEIEKQTGFMFFYKSGDIDKDMKISIRADNMLIADILTDIFKNSDLAYVVDNKHILIARKSNPAFQQIEVTGTVTDGSEPLPGANVVIKGTNTGVVADFNGRFSISVPDKDAVLQFSFVGYAMQEFTVGSQTVINVTLKEEASELAEVVVVGYGVTKKTDLTGAIAQVKADDMKNYTPANVSDLLRTNIPGMNVGYGISAKGNSSMLVRGETTLTAGAAPLIVVDGVIYGGDLSDINPNDIDRIDIMKDASSAAVYGSRATNGVVAITTKRGLSEKPVVNISGTIGLATAANRMKPYDQDGFIKWRSDMFKSVYSATVPQTPWSPFDDPRTVDPQYLNDWMAYHSTTQENLVDAWLAGLRLTGIEIDNYKAGNTRDWEDVIFQNALRQDYNVNLSGKRNDFSYYWSLGYMNNQALTIGDEFSTIRSRVNIEGQPAKFLKVGINAQFSYRDESSVPAAQGQYKNLTPYSTYYDDDGFSLRLYPNDDIQATHPLLERTYRTREMEYFTFFPKIYSILELPFGITYTMNFTTRFVFYHNYIHNSSLHPQWKLYGGSASRANSLNREWQVDNIINWNKTLFDHHRIDITLLANAEKFRGDSDEMTNQNFSPNDVLGYHDMSIGALPEMTSDDQVRTADALMARINYAYRSKYLLTLSVRRDGSSLFGYSNPYATFPAGALGWVISGEDFFNVNFIDYLKIRLSWGVNGNRNIANYAALSTIWTGKSLNASSDGAASVIPVLMINTMENKKLKWEQTGAFNLGLDFRLWKDILTGSIEAYNMTTTDVLVNRELPTITGFSRVYANLGEVRNKGFELTLNSVNMKRNNFEWMSNLVFSLNRNKIISITGEKYDVYDTNGNVIGQKESDDIDNNWFIGQAKDVIWDYKILGTWKTGQETEATIWNQAPGDFRLEDMDSDNLLTDQDKQFQGYTTPRFSWALTNRFYLFKNLEASFVLYSLWGHKATYNLAKHDDHIEDRRNSWVLPYWTPDNQLDNYARLRSAPAKGVGYSVWFKKSYIRLENIALAYKLPQRIVNKTFISDMRITFNIRNAGLWAPEWKFGDPEDGTRSQRIYSFGINMTL
ncbi:MAG: SusC/RagA family TonB-linked outer membrane protein [Bacteroidales bacterium]|nr:SusC/RagA family TonB-linked outer membrane protein [Bacteroidales bacterium]